MAIDRFLAPIDDNNPCGDNLEYDTDFLALEQAATGKAEQQFGSKIFPQQLPDWAQVERLACGLLERTKDLRVMMHLAHAWTQLRGLQGYADGLTLIHQALKLYWNSLHPMLTFEDETDPQFRINALADLGDRAALATCIRSLPLLKCAAGEISIRDASALVEGSKQECPGFPGGRARLLEELSSPEQPEGELVRRIVETLCAIQTEVTVNLGVAALPEMNKLTKDFSLLAQFSHSAASVISTDDARLPDEAVSPKFDHHDTRIQSRDDALLMLDRVKNYFRSHEPSHPAPLLIERVQRLIAQDFIEIVRDLAPDGLQQLENILGCSHKKEGT